jgi:hypothetical protein
MDIPTMELKETIRKEYYSKVAAMRDCSRRMREVSYLFEAITVYSIKKYELHWEEQMSWGVFVSTNEYSKPTLHRYFIVAKAIEVWARSTYKIKKNSFLIEEYMVEEYTTDRRTINKAISITAIYNEQKPEAIEEPREAKPDTNLFSVHDKITEAGYKFDNGKYLTPDNTEITSDQYAEFISEAEGLKIFDETAKLVDSFHKDVTTKVSQLRKDFLAFTKRHSSPKVQQVIESRHKEIEEKLVSVLHEVATLLKP